MIRAEPTAALARSPECAPPKAPAACGPSLTRALLAGRSRHSCRRYGRVFGHALLAPRHGSASCSQLPENPVDHPPTHQSDRYWGELSRPLHSSRRRTDLSQLWQQPRRWVPNACAHVRCSLSRPFGRDPAGQPRNRYGFRCMRLKRVQDEAAGTGERVARPCSQDCQCPSIVSAATSIH